MPFFTIGMDKRTIKRTAIATGLLLLIPLALQLTIGTGVDGEGWNWKLGDFVFAAVFLFIAGLALSMVWKKTGSNRILALIVGILFFVYLWAEFAVGIFTNLGS